MARLPKFYPDLWWPRLGYLLADGMALLWIAVWYHIGSTIYYAVMTLSVIANGVIATGNNVNGALSQLQRDVAGLPLVGSPLRDAIAPLHGIPKALIAQGYDELQAIQHLALLLAVIVAGVPILAAVLNYIPWRVRKTRGFRSLNRLLHRPGANAVSTTMQVLAGRAIYTLPYDRLLAYSPDPIAEWREGRFYNLARATMAEEGLDVRRYLRRMEGLAPLPAPDAAASEGPQARSDAHGPTDDLPIIGDDRS